MTTKVRSSKFRHVIGKPMQLRDCYGDVTCGNISNESNIIKANEEFFAVPWAKEGTVCVTPIDRHGAIPEDTPLIVNVNDDGARTTVTEFNFSPHDNRLLAVASQDGSAGIFRIPEGGLTSDINDAEFRVQASEKRLLGVEWHPTASGVFFTMDAGKVVSFWDAENNGAALFTLPQVHKGLLTSTSWNKEGSLLATCCKDKKLRVFDVRNSEMTGEVESHTSPKSSRVQWIHSTDQIVTTGFTRSNERELAVWDPRALDTRLSTHKLPTSSSTSMLFQDYDNGLLAVAGKGDGSIMFFELSSEEKPFIHPLSDYKSNTPQNGMAMLPKNCCNVNTCEIMRFMKLSGTRIEPIRIQVPRSESSFFQDDIYPDTWDLKATMTASEWAGGANNPRTHVSLEDKFSSE